MRKLGNKRLVSLAAISCMLMMVLSGCGSKFDASAYTQAVLDAAYKGDTEAYAKIVDISQEEADDFYQSTLDTAMSAFTDESGMELTDDQKEQYNTLFETIFNATKYTVGEATKDDDGNYTVTVTVEPIAFTGLEDKLTEKSNEYVEQVKTDVTNGGEIPTEEQMTADMNQIILEILQSYVDDVTYAEGQDVVVHITKDSDGVYQISEDDLTSIDGIMLTIE